MAKIRAEYAHVSDNASGCILAAPLTSWRRATEQEATPARTAPVQACRLEVVRKVKQKFRQKIQTHVLQPAKWRQTLILQRALTMQRMVWAQIALYRVSGSALGSPEKSYGSAVGSGRWAGLTDRGIAIFCVVLACEVLNLLLGLIDAVARGRGVPFLQRSLMKSAAALILSMITLILMSNVEVTASDLGPCERQCLNSSERCVEFRSSFHKARR